MRSLMLAFFVTLVAAFSATPSLASTAEQADTTPVETWATTVALNEVGNYEGTEDWVVNAHGYGDFGGAWCGDFVQWVLERTAIAHDAGGRGAFNYRIARNWGIFGQRGYGRKRAASTKDAMPGDIIVHNDNGTGSTGGHVSVVVKATNDPAVVWTVGGNESDAVRLRKTTLTSNGGYAYPRSLVTLTEMRYPYTDLMSGGVKVGFAQLERLGGYYGPLVRVNGITYGSSLYTDEQTDTNYRLMAIDRGTGATVSLPPRQFISTVNYRDIRVVRSTGAVQDSAHATGSGPSLAGKPVSSSW